MENKQVAHDEFVAKVINLFIFKNKNHLSKLLSHKIFNSKSGKITVFFILKVFLKAFLKN